MVAVKNHEADRYIANLPRNLSLFLVFGPDTGLVSERVDGILKHVITDRHDPFQMVEMHGDDLGENSVRLLEEAMTIGLFEGRRAIHVIAGRKSIVDAIRILLNEPPPDCVVVVSAGTLRVDAPLRTAFVRAKNSAAIECYPDQDRDISRLIDEELGQANLKISADGKAALVAALGADRLTTRAEISKLVLYCHGKDQVVEKDVYEIITGATGNIFDDAIDAAFLGNRVAATDIFSEVETAGGDVNFLVSGCIRRCLLLHRALIEIEGGAGRDSVVQKLGQNRLPPVRKKQLLSQLSTWNTQRLMLLLSRLNEFALSARQDASIAPMLANRLLWVIATSFPRAKFK